MFLIIFMDEDITPSVLHEFKITQPGNRHNDCRRWVYSGNQHVNEVINFTF